MLCILLALVGCKHKPYPDESINIFSDPQLVKIYDLQDQRKTMELIPFLKAKKESHRIKAALAFASIQADTAIPYLVQMLLVDQKEEARRAAALALGQIGSNKAARALREAFASEVSKENQRIILESIGRCIDSTSFKFLSQYEPYEQPYKLGWQYAVYRALRLGWTNDTIINRVFYYLESDSSEELQILSANYLFLANAKGLKIDSNKLINLKSMELCPEAQACVNRIGVKPEIDKLAFNPKWQSNFEANQNIYQRSALIQKLTVDDGLQSRIFLKEVLKEPSNHAVVRGAALQKLIDIEKANSFYPEFFGEILHYAIQSKEMALVSYACYALSDSSLYTSWQFVSEEELRKAQQVLELPRQLETYLDISRALEARGFQTQKYKDNYDHRINWEFVKSIPANQKVEIKTSKGNIIIQCFVNDAPGSVANFLHLVDSGFYNGKSFHRVVDNFVIQGGCPRGDGWGSLDWLQRSEFSNYQHYTEGTVGLASAGKDTEGVQWFITHCSTPFLTGRYTIFARVIEGMDVVNSIEIGDEIIDVKRINEQSN